MFSRLRRFNNNAIFALLFALLLLACGIIAVLFVRTASAQFPEPGIYETQDVSPRATVIQIAAPGATASNSANVGGTTLSEHVAQASGAPPALRGPMLMLYLNEGANELAAGGGTKQRDALIANLQPLLKYGFRTLLLRPYPGNVRLEYFAPLRAACDPAGVVIISTGYDLSVFQPFYGYSDSAEWWMLSDRPADKSKPRAPPTTQPTKKIVDRDHWAIWNINLLDSRIIDRLVTAAEASVAATGSRYVWFDWEFVLHSTHTASFWTDANIAVVSDRLVSLCERLRDKNIRPILYHPVPGMTPQYDRIALDVLRALDNAGLSRGVVSSPSPSTGEGGGDGDGWVIHLSPLTYYNPDRIAWPQPTVADAAALYAQQGVAAPLHGFASSRQVSGGVTAAEFDAMLTWATGRDRAWLFAGAPIATSGIPRIANLAADFAQLPPLP